jgi:hypothetical protein
MISMKKTVLTLLTAAALGMTALAQSVLTAATPVMAAAQMTRAQGTVRVTAAAGAQVYSDTSFTQPIKGKILAKNSTWRFSESFGEGNPDNPINAGFGLGGKQYVKWADVQTLTSGWPTKGTFIVNVQDHPAWATVLYDRNLKPIRSLPAQSRWTVFGLYQVYGQGGRYVDQYYDLGGQQYVKFVSYSTHDLSSGQFNGTFK